MNQRFESLPVAEVLPHSVRVHSLRMGIAIELVALIWMVVEAAVSLFSGYLAHSVSLAGFGLDSVIELIAGGVLLWRLMLEQRGRSLEAVERAERIAAWTTALCLFALALYLLLSSSLALLNHNHPEFSWSGLGIALAASVIMPLLWWGKLRVANQIDSGALKADAMCSATCAWMSLCLLVGLLLNALFGWWWADSLAALALLYFIVREGQEAFHEARTGESCSCCDDSE